MIRFLDHTADIAVEVEAPSLEKLFEEAGLAVMQVSADLSTVKPALKTVIEKTKDDKEKLLFDFLEEIIYLKDAEYTLFSEFKISVKGNKMRCEAWGEKIDPKRMKLDKDVKAITYHKFSLKKDGKIWKAFFILDI